MHLSRIGWILVGLAVAFACVQLLIARIIVLRKLRSEFGIFFTYCCFGVCVNLVGIAGYALSSSNQYFYLWWVISFLYIALEFGIMYEIFVNALKPYSALIDLGKMLFRWAGVFLLFAAVLTALATSGSTSGRCIAALAVAERSMRLMECGFLLLFFFLERRLGLSWRNYNASIAIGLGATAAMDLTVSYLSSHYPAWLDSLNLVNSTFGLGVFVFWASALALPERGQKSVLDSPSRLIFQRWNEAVASYSTRTELTLGGSSVMESFLPGVEQTVDRVLARKMVQ
ncbi:MAG TPA: hypothetical protein VFR84_09505 [Candidatus Angelobacter sp.]|nr:hypothetical protein [Candidatus Angelobacter sp.]